MIDAAALLSDGATSLVEGDWPRAQDCFSRALDVEASGTAHFGLGDALWWQGEIAAAEVVARRAIDHARQSGRADLELQALSVLGAVQIAQGRVDEGVACLDEAMAGSLGGQPGNPQTVVFTSCNMIKACTSCADFERVVEWVVAADHFQQTFGCAFLYASCRTEYGRVMTMTGDWVRAEQELTRALSAAEGALPAVYADAAAALGDFRLRQGRIDEAKALVAGTEGTSEVASILAALQLRQGNTAAAEALLTRGLAEVDAGGLTGGRFMEQLGEAALQRDDAATAAAHARKVTRPASRTVAGSSRHVAAVWRAGQPPTPAISRRREPSSTRRSRPSTPSVVSTRPPGRGRRWPRRWRSSNPTWP